MTRIKLWCLLRDHQSFLFCHPRLWPRRCLDLCQSGCGGVAQVTVVDGTYRGLPLRFIDTPGLELSASAISHNNRLLFSIKGAMKKHKPQLVLYVDRCDAVSFICRRSHHSCMSPVRPASSLQSQDTFYRCRRPHQQTLEGSPTPHLTRSKVQCIDHTCKHKCDRLLLQPPGCH